MPQRGDTFATANYVPDLGHVVHLDWSPVVGREMKDPHYGLVLSAGLFNQATGFCMTVPITSKAGKLGGFELPVHGGRVHGVALLSALRSLDYQNRNIAFEHAAPASLAHEANRRLHLVLPDS